MATTTEQEVFWQGDFGDEYTDRNQGEDMIVSNIAYYSKMLARTQGIRSLLELGPNRGLNLIALSRLLPKTTLSAVEINHKAGDKLKESLPDADLRRCSILEFQPDRTWDLVLISGVLIHINPDRLPDAYDVMYKSSSRYILISDYYNPVPTEVLYRGHKEKLFKRDFAGEVLDKFPDLALVDYGFSYHRDPIFPQDDLTWFLLEKR